MFTYLMQVGGLNMWTLIEEDNNVFPLCKLLHLNVDNETSNDDLCDL